MITAVSGSVPDLDTYFGRFATGSDAVLWLVREPGVSLGWDGVKGLIAQLERRRGRDHVDGLLLRQAAAASLVVPRLEERMDADQRCRREPLVARLDSHLTHNWVLQRPLFEAWGSLLVELTTSEDWHLLVPDACRLDRETLKALHTGFQLHGDRFPRLTIGFDPQARPRHDRDGLRVDPGWPGVATYVGGFQADPSVEIVELSPGEGRDGDCRPVVTLPPPGDDELAVAAIALCDGTADLGSERQSAAVEAVRRAFAAYAFDAARHLGTALLAKCPKLEPKSAAEVHAIVALAAHNRQFRTTDGNPDFDRFVERHLLAAVAVEQRPAIRCALLYRLAVTVGRRRKQFPEALEWADRAVAETRQGDLSPVQRTYLEAWARNIRALARMRVKRVADAVADADLAIEAVGRARSERVADIQSPIDPWPRELTFTHAVLVHNRASLSVVLGDEEETLRLRTLANEIDAEFQGIERLEALPWVHLYRDLQRLDLALPRALSGLEAARDHKDPFAEFIYTVNAGELAYRRGEIDLAVELWTQARTLRRRMGDPDYLVRVDVSAATVLTRAGKLAQAREIYESELTAADGSPAEQAEISAALGVIAAHAGEVEEAECWINRAIDAAVDCGERDTLMRVANVAGNVCRTLGRREDAVAAYEQALDIAGAEAEEPPPAADLLATKVGLMACGHHEPELVRSCLELLPEALEDAEAWWQVPELVAHVDAIAAEAMAAAGLEALRTAVAQRLDVGPGLEILPGAPASRRHSFDEI